MNKLKSVSFGSSIVFFLLLISACEDVIEVTTEAVDPILVVDAWLTNRNEDQMIKLNFSQGYFDNSIPPSASGATVRVSSNTGSEFLFNEINPGEYVWTAGPDSLGVLGDQFQLTITLEGKTYNALSEINRVPNIDSIGQEFEEESIVGPEGVYTNFYARDFPGFGDTYWIKTFKNGVYLNKPQELNIAYDAGFDAGGRVDGLIFIPPIRDLTNPIPDDELDEPPPPWDNGDEIRVEIHSISNEAFFFLETARDQITNGDNGLFAIPLANTNGNIVDQSGEGTVLGIFNVAAVSKIVDIIE